MSDSAKSKKPLFAGFSQHKTPGAAGVSSKSEERLLAGLIQHETPGAARRVSCGNCTEQRAPRRNSFLHARAIACSSGFTLLEILIVVAILGIAAGIAVATLDGDERGTLEREARRFAGALEYAARRAELRHETLGVSAADGQWRFWLRAADGRWRTLSEDEPLAPRALPASFFAAPLAYAGQPLALQAIVPLRPSGRNEPYAFLLAGPTLQALVSADPMNRVAVTGPQPLSR